MFYLYSGKIDGLGRVFQQQPLQFHFHYFQFVIKYSTVLRPNFVLTLYCGKFFICTGRRQISEIDFIDYHLNFNINQLMAILFHQQLCPLHYIPYKIVAIQSFLTYKKISYGLSQCFEANSKHTIFFHKYFSVYL